MCAKEYNGYIDNALDILDSFDSIFDLEIEISDNKKTEKKQEEKPQEKKYEPKYRTYESERSITSTIYSNLSEYDRLALRGASEELEPS